MWCVYIIECRNGNFYTGMTNDLARRMQAHKDGLGGKFTRAFGFKKLLYQKRCASRSAALKYEMRVKAMTRASKKELITCAKTA